MSAKIIKLRSTTRSGVMCQETGIAFPQLYRLVGKQWKFKEGREGSGVFLKSMDDLELTDTPTAPCYTLKSEHTYTRMAEPTWEPIRFLDPSRDSGWVVIRHHANCERMEGYVDAMFDTNPHDHPLDRFMACDTEFGLFTVHHRPKAQGTRDCLLVYVTKQYVPDLGDYLDWYKVIGPGGVELDENALYPEDTREDMQELIDKLNN